MHIKPACLICLTRLTNEIQNQTVYSGIVCMEYPKYIMPAQSLSRLVDEKGVQD